MKRLLALSAVLIPLYLFAQGFGGFSSDQPFFAKDSGSGECFPLDTFESGSITNYRPVNGLISGDCFTAPYVDRPGQFGLYAYDDIEGYTNNVTPVAINGQGSGTGWQGGTGWNTTYVERLGVFGTYSFDDMEGYFDTNNINGFNLGVGYPKGTNSADIFGGSYVDR